MGDGGYSRRRESLAGALAKGLLPRAAARSRYPSLLKMLTKASAIWHLATSARGTKKKKNQTEEGLQTVYLAEASKDKNRSRGSIERNKKQRLNRRGEMKKDTRQRFRAGGSSPLPAANKRLLSTWRWADLKELFLKKKKKVKNFVNTFGGLAGSRGWRASRQAATRNGGVKGVMVQSCRRAKGCGEKRSGALKRDVRRMTVFGEGETGLWENKAGQDRFRKKKN